MDDLVLEGDGGAQRDVEGGVKENGFLIYYDDITDQVGQKCQLVIYTRISIVSPSKINYHITMVVIYHFSQIDALRDLILSVFDLVAPDVCVNNLA